MDLPVDLSGDGILTFAHHREDEYFSDCAEKNVISRIDEKKSETIADLGFQSDEKE